MIIAFILPILHDQGGAEVLTFRLAEEARKKGFQVHLISVCGEGNPELKNRLIHSGIICHAYRKEKTGFSVFGAIWLTTIIAKIAPDILHSHLHVTKYLAVARLLNFRSSWIHTIHNIPEKDAPGIERRINILCTFLGMKLVGISSEIAAQSSIYYKRNIPSIPNGVPISKRIAPTKANIFTFGCMARLIPAKNVQLLISTFSRLLKSGIEAKLKIAGTGPELGKLSELVSTLGIEESIDFVGHINDPYEFMRSIDTFVLTSLHEGAPITILEAMSVGTLVIAPTVGGIPEMLDSGKCGFLYEIVSSEKLEQFMTIATRRNHTAMIEAAYQRCTHLYSIQTTFENYLSVACPKLNANQ